jgi:3-oxoacyl-[acyl-carrier protein] reductase
MMKQRWGRIISMASIAGIIGNVGQTNYSASKAGIIAFTKSIAREVGSLSITANAIAPGFIMTEMTDKMPEDRREAVLQFIALKRYGTPEDVAELAGFLASERASYITGQVIGIDGGMMA